MVKSVTIRRKKKSDNPTASIVESMEKLRADYVEEGRAHHERLRANICRAYSLGLDLARNAKRWRFFVDMDWEGIGGGPPKIGQQDDAVRFALKFMVGAGKPAQKDASLYHRAIRRFIDEEITPDELREQLASTTLRELAANPYQRKKSFTAKPVLDAKGRRPIPQMHKTAAVEEVSEHPPASKNRLNCTFLLDEKQQEALLKSPCRVPITIEGAIVKVGPGMEIDVTAIKKREGKKAA